MASDTTLINMMANAPMDMLICKKDGMWTAQFREDRGNCHLVSDDNLRTLLEKTREKLHAIRKA